LRGSRRLPVEIGIGAKKSEGTEPRLLDLFKVILNESFITEFLREGPLEWVVPEPRRDSAGHLLNRRGCAKKILSPRQTSYRRILLPKVKNVVRNLGQNPPGPRGEPAKGTVKLRDLY